MQDKRSISSLLLAFHYIPAGQRILEMPQAKLKNARSAVRCTRWKKPEELFTAFTSFHSTLEDRRNLDLPVAMFTQPIVLTRYQHWWKVTRLLLYKIPATTFLNSTMLKICLQRCSHTQPLPQVPSLLIVGDRMFSLPSWGGPWSRSSKKKLDITRGYPYG